MATILIYLAGVICKYDMQFCSADVAKRGIRYIDT
jgi:hypothetical protein